METKTVRETEKVTKVDGHESHIQPKIQNLSSKRISINPKRKTAKIQDRLRQNLISRRQNFSLLHIINDLDRGTHGSFGQLKEEGSGSSAVTDQGDCRSERQEPPLWAHFNLAVLNLTIFVFCFILEISRRLQEEVQ